MKDKKVYWNKYKVISNKIVETANVNEEKYVRKLLDASYQGVKRLLFLAYNSTEDNNQVFVDFFQE